LAFYDENIEGVKLLFDYFKHLTTLSVGSIVILTTLLKNIYPCPLWPIFASSSLVFFLLSILASLVVMIIFTKIMGEAGIREGKTKKILMVFFYISILCFFLAICSLVIFSVKNIA